MKTYTIEQYERVERWCRENIAAGREFLFDPELFRQALDNACIEFDFSHEVSSKNEIALLFKKSWRAGFASWIFGRGSLLTG
jgi:hypothetical protein